MRAPDIIRGRAKSLRRRMTPSERLLWYMLKGDALRLHFRRQHPIGPFILDFYCASAKLGVEVDGPVHDETAGYDTRRDEWLAKEGIRVLRFTLDDLEQRPAWVVATIAQAAPPSTA
jgi:very-short-patch-repair endonuclease